MSAIRGMCVLILAGGLLAGGLVGCPAPDFSLALLVAPTSLDFGTEKDILTFSVAKVFSSQPLAPIRVTTTQPWIVLSNVDPQTGAMLPPEDGVSNGPDDPITVVVQVDRTKMGGVAAQGEIRVTSVGVVPKTVTVTANASLVANFSADATDVFVNELVTFRDQSTFAAGYGPITNWIWDFGDGSSSTVQNPTHRYLFPGAYTVSLRVVSANAATQTVRTQYIKVSTKIPPVAQFTASQTSVNLGSSLQFIDQSVQGSLPISGWLWNFGDGQTSTEQSPSHQYAHPGTYTVSLTVTADTDSDTETKVNYINVVRKAPVADFVATPTQVLTGQNIYFDDTSTPGSSAILQWRWNFGDGQTSLEQNPVHVYQNAGNYTVTLEIYDGFQQVSTTKTNYIHVTEATAPTAGFVGVPTNVFTGQVVNFTDISTPGSRPISSWFWSFGDGSTSTVQNPSHVYQQQGTYTVSLTVSDGFVSNTAVRDSYIQVELSVPPTPDFGVSSTLAAVQQILSFYDQSTPGNHPITTWTWDFGDGGASAQRNPSHAYARPGLYTVKLTVADATGSYTATKADFIRVKDMAIPNFSATPLLLDVGGTVQFTDATTVPAQALPVTQRTWDFGDGQTAVWKSNDPSTAGNLNPAHTYLVDGTFTVTLTVTDGIDSVFESKSNYIRVTRPPSVDFTWTPNPTRIGMETSFTDLTTAGSRPVDNQWQWLWYFGDGDDSTEQNPKHTYTAEGTYTVSLTVFDGEKLASVSKTITVLPPDLTALFTSDKTRIFPDMSRQVQFTDQSLPGPGATITSWAWDFGDFQTSGEKNPSHTYGAAGSYDVSLTVVNNEPKTSTLTKNKYIRVFQNTALDAYVNAAETYPPAANLAKSWKSLGTIPLGLQNVTAQALELTSLAWHTYRTPADVDSPYVWKHRLTVITPTALNANIGVGRHCLLYLTGGTTADLTGTPPAPPADLIQFAISASTRVAVLTVVPNQPITFADAPGTTYSEDKLLAFSMAQYLNGADEQWPVLLPMTKAAVRAMDALSEWASDNALTPFDGFVVAGAGKRGWAAWLTAAVDPRVKGVAPLVFNQLNFDVQGDYYKSLYTSFSSTLYPVWVDFSPIGFDVFGRLSLARGQALLGPGVEGSPLTPSIDPYRLLDRFSIPKYAIMATGDHYTAPDATQHYYSALVDSTRFTEEERSKNIMSLRFVPNVNQTLVGSNPAVTGPENALQTAIPWYRAVANDSTSMPQISWVASPGSTTLTVTVSGGTPTVVRQWQSTASTRDFRSPGVASSWQSTTLTASAPGTYTATVAPTPGQTVAYFVEIQFSSGSAFPYTYTTEVVLATGGSGAVGLVQPAANSVVNPAAVFSWRPREDTPAVEYSVDLTPTTWSGIRPEPIRLNGLRNPYTVFKGDSEFALADGATYEWTVTAYDADGNPYASGETRQVMIDSRAATIPTAEAADINGDGRADARDVQMAINAILQLGQPAPIDITGDRRGNVADVQFAINAILGLH